MKKSLIRADNLINDFNFEKIYLLSQNHMFNKLYVDYISTYINIDKKKIIILNSKNINSVGHDGNNIILLCGKWYLNKLAKGNNFNRFIESYFKISVPIDEMEWD